MTRILPSRLSYLQISWGCGKETNRPENTRENGDRRENRSLVAERRLCPSSRCSKESVQVNRSHIQADLEEGWELDPEAGKNRIHLNETQEMRVVSALSAGVEGARIVFDLRSQGDEQIRF